jgi:GNAT superfamily N-acetyltransferase
MINVRELNASDFDVWLPLWQGYLEFYEVSLDAAITRHTFDRLVASSTSMHGAIALDDAGKTVGMVNWLTHPGTWSTQDKCYLEDLFVAKDARGTGAGRALIEHVREWARLNSADKVYWLTAESNATAQQLYDRLLPRPVSYITKSISSNFGCRAHCFGIEIKV